jgi:hypothetical protein
MNAMLLFLQSLTKRQIELMYPVWNSTTSYNVVDGHYYEGFVYYNGIYFPITHGLSTEGSEYRIHKPLLCEFSLN